MELGIISWVGSYWIVSLVLTVLWGVILYKLANLKSGNPVPFYLTYFLPSLLFVGFLLVVAGITNSLLVLGVALLLIVWKIFLGMTLYETASEGNTKWFVMIFIFEILWIVYKLTNE